MTEEKRLDMLFYELASQDRIAILRDLCNSQLKMQDVARRLDLTATEASRQLQRMCQAKVIERGPEGTYATTQLGRLLLTLSASMEMVYKHDDYFLTHNLMSIPLPFVNRIGELSQSTLISDLNEDLARTTHKADSKPEQEKQPKTSSEVNLVQPTCFLLSDRNFLTKHANKYFQIPQIY